MCPSEGLGSVVTLGYLMSLFRMVCQSALTVQCRSRKRGKGSLWLSLKTASLLVVCILFKKNKSCIYESNLQKCNRIPRLCLCHFVSRLFHGLFTDTFSTFKWMIEFCPLFLSISMHSKIQIPLLMNCVQWNDFFSFTIYSSCMKSETVFTAPSSANVSAMHNMAS